MSGKLIKKKFYRIKFELLSPLAIGSSGSTLTDKDIIRDGRGIPYIPGSALAGLGRRILKRYEPSTSPVEESELADCGWLQHYMGNVKKAKEEDMVADACESRILFYDAQLNEQDLKSYHISRRDGVGLDEWRTAKKGSKYDYEIIEPGVRFVTFIEQNIYENQMPLINENREKGKKTDVYFVKKDEPVADLIAREWLEGSIYLGAKTTRGLGSIKNVVIETREFTLGNNDSARQYADFDPFSEEDWQEAVPFACSDELKDMRAKEWSNYQLMLKLSLKLDGAILIRKYSTKVGDNEEGTEKTERLMPDFLQLYILGEDGEEIPVIPGTTWAGAFRAQMEKLIPGSTAGYYGLVDQVNKTKKKSEIRFSESKLSGSKSKQISRNAIDRFSGGTIDGALFTEKIWYGGETELVISFGKNTTTDFDKALAASIADLNCGLMTVGGAVSVGRGKFTVNAINGSKAEVGEKIYDQVYKLIIEMKKRLDGDSNGGL